MGAHFLCHCFIRLPGIPCTYFRQNLLDSRLVQCDTIFCSIGSKRIVEDFPWRIQGETAKVVENVFLLSLFKLAGIIIQLGDILCMKTCGCQQFGWPGLKSPTLQNFVKLWNLQTGIGRWQFLGPQILKTWLDAHQIEVRKEVIDDILGKVCKLSFSNVFNFNALILSLTIVQRVIRIPLSPSIELCFSTFAPTVPSRHRYNR